MSTTYNLYYQTASGVIKSPVGVKAWGTSKIYATGATVLSGGTVYTCDVAHTSAAAFDSEKWSPKKIEGITDTINNLGNLDPLKTYYIALSTVKDGVESTPCPEVHVKPIDTSIPSGLSVSFDPMNVGSIDANWSSVSVLGSKATSYNIYYSVLPSFTKEQSIIGTSLTTDFKLTSMDRATSFYFYVTANYKNALGVTIEGDPSVVIKAGDPSQTQNIQAVADITSVTFTWDPCIINNNFPVGYSILISEILSSVLAGTARKIEVDGTSVSETVSGLTADTQYFYSIQTRYKDTAGAPQESPVLTVSPAPSVTTLPVPVAPTPTP